MSGAKYPTLVKEERGEQVQRENSEEKCGVLRSKGIACRILKKDQSLGFIRGGGTRVYRIEVYCIGTMHADSNGERGEAVEGER